MRHKDTAALREMLKGYTAQDEERPTDQQEQLPMPPMFVVRGSGATISPAGVGGISSLGPAGKPLFPPCL